MPTDYRQLMQEKLDETLAHEESEALLEHLAQDEQAAQEHAKLETVHRALEHAPQMRAPKRLAATIMARLAQTLEMQAQAQQLPQEMRMALMLSTSMVTMMMMPTMLMATYLVVNLSYNPKLLNKVILRVIALQVMMIDALVILMEEVEENLRKDPEAAQVALALIPVALKGMLDYMQESNVDIETGEFEE